LAVGWRWAALTRLRGCFERISNQTRCFSPATSVHAQSVPFSIKKQKEIKKLIEMNEL